MISMVGVTLSEISVLCLPSLMEIRSPQCQSNGCGGGAGRQRLETKV